MKSPFADCTPLAISRTDRIDLPNCLFLDRVLQVKLIHLCATLCTNQPFDRGKVQEPHKQLDTQFLFSSRKEGRGYRLYYQHTTPITRCWFQTYFCSPLFGNHSHFDSYFTIGLKPPNLGTPLKFHIDIHIDTKTDGLEKIYLLLNMAILAIYVEFQGR